MQRRHAIADAQWERIGGLLLGRKRPLDRPAEDNSPFLDAVLWVGKAGVPWRDRPERFGDWSFAWRRFDRWAR